MIKVGGEWGSKKVGGMVGWEGEKGWGDGTSEDTMPLFYIFLIVPF